MNSQEFDDLDVSELNENADFAEDSKAEKAAAPKAKRTAKVPKQKINQDDEKIESTEERGWFVVHCYSGYENKVRHNLEQRIDMGMKEKYLMLSFLQEEIEVKDGKRKTIERHIFPGYVLVNMILTKESWYIVRIPCVTGFVGMKPTDLCAYGRSLLNYQTDGIRSPVVSYLQIGERVRIGWAIQRFPWYSIRN